MDEFTRVLKKILESLRKVEKEKPTKTVHNAVLALEKFILELDKNDQDIINGIGQDVKEMTDYFLQNYNKHS
ncbi:MAG: hypothetical protein QM487_03520 [Candidatus Marithrix sp.]